MNYRTAAEAIASKRKALLANATFRYNEMLKKHSELFDAELAYKKAIIRGGDYVAAKAVRDSIIIKLGCTPEQFEPPVNCSACGDSGYVNGRVCKCAIGYAVVETGYLPIPAHTFEDSNPDFFDDSSRADLEKSYAVMRSFCNKFPNTNARNILILGGCGTGKTFLACCTANELLARGYSCLFVSAFRFNEFCLKYHTSFSADRTDYLNALTSCDLLVLDDLGSESILKNVTVEYLYLVVDERMRLGKHTIITSNLSRNMLDARYTTRTTSRMFANRECMTIALVGTDLRSK